ERNFLGRLVALGRVAELARIRHARFRADERDFAAGFLEAVVGIPNFKLLVLLLDENGGAFVVQVHGGPFDVTIRAREMAQLARWRGRETASEKHRFYWLARYHA